MLLPTAKVFRVSLGNPRTRTGLRRFPVAPKAER